MFCQRKMYTLRFFLFVIFDWWLKIVLAEVVCTVVVMETVFRYYVSVLYHHEKMNRCQRWIVSSRLLCCFNLSMYCVLKDCYNYIDICIWSVRNIIQTWLLFYQHEKGKYFWLNAELKCWYCNNLHTFLGWFFFLTFFTLTVIVRWQLSSLKGL